MKLFLFFMFLSISVYSSEIRYINNPEELNNNLSFLIDNENNDHVWFIWDVDNVLITTTDIFGRPNGQKICQSILRSGLYTNHQIDTAFGLMMVKSNYKLFNSNNQIIQKLNCKNFTTMAITGLRTNLPGFENLLDWRIQQLLNFQISFNFQIDYDNQIDFNDGASFKKGILFSGTKTKGEALSLLCTHINDKPKKIVMVDDSFSALESVKKICDDSGILFFGLHYQDDQIFKEEIPDETIINYQLNTLVNQHQMVDYIYDCIKKDD